jgi:hypothetical protein
MYLSNARLITSETVSPFIKAFSFDLRHNSSSTRTLRSGVLGWLGIAVHQCSQTTPNRERKILIKIKEETIGFCLVDNLHDRMKVRVTLTQKFCSTFRRLSHSVVVNILLSYQLRVTLEKFLCTFDSFLDTFSHFSSPLFGVIRSNNLKISGVSTPCQAPFRVNLSGGLVDLDEH